MPTPTLDRLASEGVKLESYYVQPLCSPTRSTIMTGRYPCHTGVGPDVLRIDWPVGVPGREVFLPEKLKQAGYVTRMIGCGAR
jgi:arylsulfatase A-like enzyme